MDTLWQDIRYGARMLWKKPAFAVVAVLTLALGIGANTAIFSVINSTVLQPLDYKNPGQLVDLNSDSRQRGITFGGVSVPEFLEWKKQAKSFEGMAAYRFFAFTYTQDTGAQRVNGFEVSPNLFTVLGETPLLGRFFIDGDDRPGADNLLVVNESFWRTQLGSDPGIIGKTLRVDSKPFTVVGVTRAAFNFPGAGTLMWKPLPLTNVTLLDWTDRQASVVARRKSGVSMARAGAEMQKNRKRHRKTTSGNERRLEHQNHGFANAVHGRYQ